MLTLQGSQQKQIFTFKHKALINLSSIFFPYVFFCLLYYLKSSCDLRKDGMNTMVTTTNRIVPITCQLLRGELLSIFISNTDIHTHMGYSEVQMC